MAPDTSSETTETLNEEDNLSTATPGPPSFKYQAQAELRRLLLIDLTIRKDIASAKTNVKKRYLKKKLAKNDLAAKRMLLYLEKIGVQAVDIRP